MAKGTLMKVEPNGTLTPVRVEDKKGWTVEQLYHLIGNGCNIVEGMRVTYDEKPRIAYVDENARLAIQGRPIPPVNEKATRMYRAYYGPGAPEILGVAVVWIPDAVEGTIRRGVISTRRKRAERSYPTPEQEDIEMAKDSLSDDTPTHFGKVTPAAPGSDEV